MQANWSQDSYIQAYRFAAQAHSGQTVPGTDLPYVMHVSFVCISHWTKDKIAHYREEAVQIFRVLEEASPMLASRLLAKIEGYKAYI